MCSVERDQGEYSNTVLPKSCDPNVQMRVSGDDCVEEKKTLALKRSNISSLEEKISKAVDIDRLARQTVAAVVLESLGRLGVTELHQLATLDPR